MTDDFSPWVSEHIGEKARGILGRRAGRKQLEPAPAGQVRVMIDVDGAPSHEGGPTSNAMYWGRAPRWILVDAAPHVLSIELREVHANRWASFDVDAVVRVQVTDPEIVVRERVTSVRSAVEATTRETVTLSLSELEYDNDESEEPDAWLFRQRRAIETTMRQALASPSQRVPGLRLDLMSIAVRFDATTLAHQTKVRAGDRDRSERQQELSERIKVREQWQEHLIGQVQNPLHRHYAALFDNPTPEAIQSAVTEANKQDWAKQTALIEVLTTLVDNKLVDDPKDTVKIINRLRTVLESSDTSKVALPSTPAKVASDEPIDAVVVDPDPPTLAQAAGEHGGDRDWRT